MGTAADMVADVAAVVGRGGFIPDFFWRFALFPADSASVGNLCCCSCET